MTITAAGLARLAAAFPTIEIDEVKLRPHGSTLPSWYILELYTAGKLVFSKHLQIAPEITTVITGLSISIPVKFTQDWQD